MNPELITKWRQEKEELKDFVITFQRWEEQEFNVVVEAKTAEEAENKVWKEGVYAAKEGTEAIQIYDFVGDECNEVQKTQTLEEATRNNDTFGVDEKKASLTKVKKMLESLISPHSVCAGDYFSFEGECYTDVKELIQNFLKHH